MAQGRLPEFFNDRPPSPEAPSGGADEEHLGRALISQCKKSFQSHHHRGGCFGTEFRPSQANVGAGLRMKKSPVTAKLTT